MPQSALTNLDKRQTAISRKSTAGSLGVMAEVVQESRQQLSSTTAALTKFPPKAPTPSTTLL